MVPISEKETILTMRNALESMKGTGIDISGIFDVATQRQQFSDRNAVTNPVLTGKSYSDDLYRYDGLDYMPIGVIEPLTFCCLGMHARPDLYDYRVPLRILDDEVFGKYVSSFLVRRKASGKTTRFDLDEIEHTYNLVRYVDLGVILSATATALRGMSGILQFNRFTHLFQDAYSKDDLMDRLEVVERLAKAIPLPEFFQSYAKWLGGVSISSRGLVYFPMFNPSRITSTGGDYQSLLSLVGRTWESTTSWHKIHNFGLPTGVSDDGAYAGMSNADVRLLLNDMVSFCEVAVNKLQGVRGSSNSFLSDAFKLRYLMAEDQMPGIVLGDAVAKQEDSKIELLRSGVLAISDTIKTGALVTANNLYATPGNHVSAVTNAGRTNALWSQVLRRKYVSSPTQVRDLWEYIAMGMDRPYYYVANVKYASSVAANLVDDDQAIAVNLGGDDRVHPFGTVSPAFIRDSSSPDKQRTMFNSTRMVMRYGDTIINVHPGSSIFAGFKSGDSLDELISSMVPEHLEFDRLWYKVAADTVGRRYTVEEVIDDNFVFVQPLLDIQRGYLKKVSEAFHIPLDV